MSRGEESLQPTKKDGDGDGELIEKHEEKTNLSFKHVKTIYC